MIARQQRRSVRALTVVLLALCALALTSVPASAKIVHSYEGSFDTGEALEPLSYLFSDAVDSSSGTSSGDVYVGGLTASFAGVVDKFNEEGKYASVTITGAETPQGSFGFYSPSNSDTSGIAVDNSDSANKGDLYVADIEHGVVDKFSESGTFICQITGKTTEETIKETVPTAKECDSAGSGLPGSLEPTGLAVQSAIGAEEGYLYVADAAEGHAVIDEFKPSGEYVGQIANSHISEPGPIAVDANGNLLVDNTRSALSGNGQEVVELDAAGSFVSVLDSHGTVVGVDPSDGHLYVGHAGEIAEYDASGALLDTFGSGEVGDVVGIGVGTTGRVYAGELELVGGVAANQIKMFGPDLIIPDVAVGATEDQRTSATLTGSVNPAGGPDVTECKFEYVTEKQFQEHSADPYEGAVTAPCEPPASTPYSAPTAVAAHITGLTPEAVYHFRLVAANANGVPDYGEDHVFGPPTIDSEAASAVVGNATVRAQIDPEGVETTCEVQYVDEAEFQASGYAEASSVPCAAEVGWEAGERSASATLGGLALDTTYHYRFVATNGVGMATGADETFVTFGLESFTFGVSSAQAGAHPDLTDSFALNTSTDPFGRQGTDANPEEVQTELPPGLIGDPDATPKCSAHHVERRECSPATQVGVITVATSKDHAPGYVEPLYNVVPPAGVAARFGAEVSTFGTTYIDARVRSGSDYGVTADAAGISADEGILAVSVRLWGVPADPSHDGERWNGAGEGGHYGASSEVPPVPFLTSPTSCSGPLNTTMRVNSWQAPASFAQAVSEMAGMTGCERLHFTPTIEVTPESTSSDSPTGLSVDLHVPQNEDPDGLAEADLRDALVTLPEGVTVNPSNAYGRQGCSPAQIELHGPAPAQCPDASKIGSVQIETPLLEHALQGGVYLAQQGNAGPAQGENPFGSLLAIYIAVDEPQSGVVVKLAGEVGVNQQTGRLTTTFDEDPQLPFEELKLNFFGGSRAPLSTPPACGTYTTVTALTPWSAPESGPAATPFSTFPISSAPGGSPCAAQGFSPSFAAGTSNNQAAAFSPFTLKFSRQDGEQTLSTISTQMPPGLLGMLSKVQLCGEPQAQAGTCPATSQVGHVTATAGVGNQPLTLPEAGKPQDPVFLTGPYHGAPFGLSIDVPAEAGPFDLGTVVVRAAVHIDPATSQISVTSEPMPTRLQGIPLDVRSVEVTIDREGFMLNPTNCEPLAVSGTIGSAEGAVANVSSRYETANCATLPFKPAFAASTQAKTSKVGGASLVVKVTQNPGEANIHRVDLQLPKVLPSRDSTLKQACTEAQFNDNPADCPAGSVIGTATARTPLLQVPLTGPAYLVSHGGAAFPDVEYVLQADERGGNIEIVLDGKTQIKNGITYSRFETVPDAPISSFETDLPEGPHSIFSTEYPGVTNLCAVNLLMPITIVGQNGAVEKHDPRIDVTGCRDALSIASRSLEGRTLVLHVVVPAAGKLTADGRGLKTISKSAGGRGTLTLVLKQKHAGRLSTKIKLSFKPSKGRKLAKSLSVTFTR